MALIDNLVSYWKLDEASGNAIDAHGSNDLTETSGTIGTASGKINSARDFVAADTEYFTIADNTDLSIGDVDCSWTFWIKPDSIGAKQMILCKEDGVSGGDYYIFIQASGVMRLEVFASAAFGGGGTVDASTFGALSAGNWYFCVAWHDSVTNEIGISVNDTSDTASRTTGIWDGTGAFEMGIEVFGGSLSNAYDGLIDEVGFWKGRVLDSSERTQLYNSGSGLAYPFDGGGGVSPPDPPYSIRKRGAGLAEIAWPAWGQAFRF